MFALVQIVHIYWSKKARGGPLADFRSDIPISFSLDTNGFASCADFYIERQHWSEKNHFESPIIYKTFYETANAHEFRCAIIERLEKEVRVIWKWNGIAGAPERYPSEHQISVLHNQWLQFRWNGRFSDWDSGIWWYEEVVMNVACLSPKPDKNFFASKPDRCCDYRAPLW